MTLRPPPRKAVIEITRACNMTCLHCASAAGRVRPNELKTAQMLQLIDDLKAMGVEDVVFWGSHWCARIGQYRAERVRSHGMSLGMVSNGTFALKQMTHSQFADCFLDGFDGLEATHNQIRNSPAAFHDLVAAFRELAEHEVYRFAVTSISKLNLGQLEDMYRLLLDLEVVGWQLQLTFPSGRMRQNDQWLCQPQDLYYITDFLSGVARESLLELHTGNNIGYYTDCEEGMRGCNWRGREAGAL